MDGNGSMETLCRICLENGATIPIFETDKKENNVHFKLSMCFSEKIEDVKGYPRNICESCNNTLETVCNFISRYKETCKILENGILIVKKENFSDYSYNEHSEVEIEISDIKTEPIDINEHLNTTGHLIEKEKPLKITCEFVKRPIKRERRTSIKNNTSKIASSILEGDFLWTGEKWCLKSRKTTIPAKNEQVKTVKQKEIKIKKAKGTKPIPPKLCDVCGEVFKTQDKLSVHKRNVHFKKPVKCPKCPRVCCSIYYLNRHIKRKHENVKNFVCTACGARFTFKGELTSHFRNVHDKDLKPKKVFACKLCDKTYKCAKSVLVHERSVHTGQRPAVCSVCGTSFYHEDYLKEHMRLHTGETPFKCPVCGRGYAQRCNMKSHLRIHRISELDAATLSKIKPNYLKLLKV